MTSEELRKSFIDFFRNKNHTVVKSSPLVPKGDPTLLFTSAGMVQFKPYWSGAVPLPYKRACSVQKCLRLSDLEKVGETPFHETFFEMLGNFSFGDYFKKEAIEWGWEFITDVLQLPNEKLSVTVYKEDKEAYDIWKNHIGVSQKKIHTMGEKTNFWGPAGKTGACGPSTEIFFDLGEEFGGNKDECTIENDCIRYVEIWNIVFPQFDRQKDGSDKPLMNRGIDTGMGLERTLMVCQQKNNIFDTDLFLPIIKKITKGLERTPKNIIADHIRALSFAITEGVVPSNEERGYVIRRILRGAVLQARKLGYKEPFLFKLVGPVVDIMGNAYPEIREKAEHASLVIKAEEERFLNTLDAGMEIFEEMLGELRKKKTKVIPGNYIFKLYDTYGFPLEISQQLASDEGFSLDVEGYKREMEKQRERAKSATKFSGEVDNLKWNIKGGKSQFVGYNKLSVDTKIVGIKKLNDNIGIILEETPFYAEMGGQVGDTGKIIGDGLDIEIIDTQPSPYGNVHIGEKTENIPKVGLNVQAKVDRNRRMDIARNHTATHLLQAALREVLGKHIHQEGSLVAPDRLRFDFTHFSAVKGAELERVEEIVNSKILLNLSVEASEMRFDEAKKLGAIALFNEKYGEIVRVLKIGNYSIELCGGTHVNRTGEIGLFKVISESSVSSGVRRIEAVTGRGLLNYLNSLSELIKNLSVTLKTDKTKIEQRIKILIAEGKKMQQRMENLARRINSYEAKTISPEKISSGINLFVKQVAGQSPEMLRNFTDEVKTHWEKQSIGVFGCEYNGRLNITAFVSKDLTSRIKAKDIVGLVAPIIGGGGGGRDDFATAGGKERTNLNKALEKARVFIKKTVS